MIAELDDAFWDQLLTRIEIQKVLFRCFLWLVSELANVWDSQVELAGSMVGDGSEVDEVFESPSHSLC